MRRGPLIALLISLSTAGGVSAQLLDETLVPAGHLRVQAHPWFQSWDARYGIADDGTEVREELGQDLTDPTGLAVYPGLATLVSDVRAMTGNGSYDPTLGDARGRVSRDVTRVDFGAHLGVFDWLTVGVVLPWVQTRTGLDLSFGPDTVGGAQLGVNPVVSSGPAVTGFLTALQGSAAAAEAAATSACAGGPSASCSSAQVLAARAGGLSGSAASAYGASAFFPLSGSTAATDLAAVLAALDADLVAAGLAPIGVVMPFATDVVGSDVFRSLAATRGAGIEASPLVSGRGLWRQGDVEVSALVRLLDIGGAPAMEDGVPGASRPGFRLSAGALVRLPTGVAADPDILFDLGTGDAQTDFEARLLGSLDAGRLHLAAGGLFGVQSSTTLVKRVAPHEMPIAPLAFRREVRWQPPSYLALEVEPGIRITDELTLTGAVRYFERGRDEYELVVPDASLDPVVLERESGVKHTGIAVGFRYSTLRSWRNDRAATPLEMHFRVVSSRSGSGGATPVASRVEVGLRLFKRFWGG